jgi:hypothetical protein
MIFLWAKTAKGVPTPLRWPDDVEDAIRAHAKVIEGTERILNDSERGLSLNELAKLYPCDGYETTSDAA